MKGKTNKDKTKPKLRSKKVTIISIGKTILKRYEWVWKKRKIGQNWIEFE